MLLHNKYTFHEFGLDTVRFKGGGSSGKSDYPEYMKTVHGLLLDSNGADTPNSSVIDAFNDALGSSPWSGETAYDPTTPLADMWTAVGAYDSVVKALDSTNDWMDAVDNAVDKIDSKLYSEDFVSSAYLSFMNDLGLSIIDASTYVDQIMSDEVLDKDVDAYARQLDDEIDNGVLTKFRAGMRDINAVNSSTFILGEALILGMKGRDVGKYSSSLRMESFRQRSQMVVDLTGKGVSLTQLKLANLQDRNKLVVTVADQIIKVIMSKIEFEKSVAMIVADVKTKHIIANKEYTTENLSIAESDAKWDLELFTYPGNLLAGIGGGTAGSGQKQPSTAQSALGGAMAGAAAGSAFGPWGAAIGGIVGAGAALLS